MPQWIEIKSSDPALPQLAKDYGVNPFAVEDCLNRDQRPKLDDYQSHQFLVWFMYSKNKVYELQFLIFPDKVIMVPFDAPPEGANWKDYLKIPAEPKDVWHLLYYVLDKMTDITWQEVRILLSKVDEIEQAIFKKDVDPNELIKLKKKLHRFDYSFGHLASVIEQLQDLIQPTNELKWKFRDLHDHCERIYESVALYRSHIASAIEMLWGLESNRTNRQIKKLTLVASIAVPLTFWSSFWGMNFHAIPFEKPELFWFAIAMMVLSVAVTSWLLVRKGYWD
ncbi:MAG: corA [Pseudobdellovibrio sp.]|jgi:magnesium transporter|nr:corA [Pseudobdellovibrio sp.]